MSGYMLRERFRIDVPKSSGPVMLLVLKSWFRFERRSKVKGHNLKETINEIITKQLVRCGMRKGTVMLTSY